MPRAAMIFAAGFGTRMGALTRDRPKPLLPVAGRSLLDRSIDLAFGAGVETVVVNAHYHAGQVVAHLAERGGVQVSVEAPTILDTGGGLRKALPMLGPPPLFTLNSDAVWDGPNPLEVLRGAWRPGEMQALLLCVPLERAVGRKGAGDFSLAADGGLSRGGALVYTGAQILITDGLVGIEAEAFSLNVLWDAVAAQGGLRGVVYPGRWCDVGHPEGLELARAMIGRAEAATPGRADDV